ncbi:hypothetical protein PR048_026948 [Dryococelus australis]|uniref:Uncharacterized protein n=1 Tax=Dryococelus australis TaxID=614101 RepID=A0ABQ9GMS0_9NEOP|nr:hypothetical protein PR048_026948 [Dryococelus australis]
MCMKNPSFNQTIRFGGTTVQRPPSLIAQKGLNQVSAATSLERGRNVTITCAMIETGFFIPPMFVYPGARSLTGLRHGGSSGSVYKMSKSPMFVYPGARSLTGLRHGGPSGSVYKMSKSPMFVYPGARSLTGLRHGGSSGSVYKMSKSPMFVYPGARSLTGLRHGGPSGSVYKMSKSGCYFLTDNPALHLMDNYSIHASLATYNFCKINGIAVLSLPPDTSHRIQPLYVSFTGPLKHDYNSDVGTAVSGFEKTGIFPLNPNVFCDEDFAPAPTKDEITSVVHNDETNKCGRKTAAVEVSR